MRPDVDRFVVQVEDGDKGVAIGRVAGMVARANEGVVTSPGRQVVPEEIELGLGRIFGPVDGGEEGVFGGGRGGGEVGDGGAGRRASRSEAGAHGGRLVRARAEVGGAGWRRGLGWNGSEEGMGERRRRRSRECEAV